MSQPPTLCRPRPARPAATARPPAGRDGGRCSASAPPISRSWRNGRTPPLTPALGDDRLRAAFPVDWADLEPADGDRIAEALREALADPELSGGIPGEQVERLARQFPAFAERFVALHGLYARSRQRLEMVDEGIGLPGNIGGGRLPWEEVRDWFHHGQQLRRPASTATAEALAEQIAGDEASPRIRPMQQWLRREGVTIEWKGGGPLRRFDAETRTLDARFHRSPTNPAASSWPIKSAALALSDARSPRSSPPRPCRPKPRATCSPSASATMPQAR